MNTLDKDLLAEFVIESQEGLADIERQMLAIEAAGPEMDAEQVNAVFRTMHSIKGAAGFLGLERIGALAHRLEELLNHLRNRELVATSELVTSMLKAADCMTVLLAQVETSNEIDISEHIAALSRFLPDGAAAEPPASPPTPRCDAVQLSDAAREFLIECHENLDQMDQDLLALERSPQNPQLLRSSFRTLHAIKGGAALLGLHGLEQLAHAAETVLGKLRDGAIPLNAELMTLLVETVNQCRQGLALVEMQGHINGFDASPLIGALNACCCSSPSIASASSPAESAPSPASATSPAPPQSPPRANDAETDKNAGLSESTIRVDVALLDKLMTRVGELVLARNQILQHVSRINSTEFLGAAQRLNLITTELQEGVMKTRMQPIGNVWSKFPRVVRDLASQLNKQVRIELEGKETELDKTIIEAIKDPLTHLVRNAVDHGIEPTDVRVAAGKPSEGRLLLRAYHEGGQVNIEISDDGRGLNLDRIRAKAIERGLVSADQAARLSDQETAQFIFSAGFSTAEAVTSVSGRGVGMDVVKTNIERIGGVIDLVSRPGQGVTVRIKIPLTLAIIPALVVMSEEERYAIPQVSLMELVRLEGEDDQKGVEFIHGAPVYRLRGKLLPLVFLSERLGLLTAEECRNRLREPGRAINIVVLKADERQFGLVVDRVCDTEEIVVKPLGKQLKKITEYAGATIMGDGGVALILDVKGLALAAGVTGEMRALSAAEDADDSKRTGQELESVLVVDAGDDRRFALPISRVSRLEKIPSTMIERARGAEVIQYRGTILPLLRLADVIGALHDPTVGAESLQVVVYANEKNAFGLIVGRIVDTCDIPRLPPRAPDAEGPLLQTLVIQQRVTDILDLDYLGRTMAAGQFSFSASEASR